MNNTYYQLYRDDVFVLARTLSIKLSDVAETINAQLKQYGYNVDEVDYTTWKYYLNLAGQYHDSDDNMTVRSMDTLETIAFTRENLRTHRATAREYRFGTRYYSDLVARYPQQVTLINGILSPVEAERAYHARDGEILYHDQNLVEGNETNLIRDLQSWIYIFLSRWHNRQYLLQDDLYLPAMLGTMYAQLPGVIQTIRLKNCNTPRAHSFHIREYLASNGRLDVYLPYLDKHQQLFLYRNLRWIRRNVGKQATFNRLVDEILTHRDLPLAAYQLRHNIGNMPEQPRPSVDLTKYPLNSDYNQTGINTSTVHTIFDKERQQARDNASVQEAAEQDLTERFSSQWFSSLPTKVLESEIEDRSNASVRSLEDVLTTQWLYLATHNRYRAYVAVANPSTGAYMNLSVRDALIVATYAFYKARGMETDTIPRLIAYETLRDPLPRFDELRALVPREYVSDEMITAVMDRITPMGDYISTEGFYNAAFEFHSQYKKLWELYSFQEHMNTRAFMEQVVKRHYQHIQCALIDNEVLSFEQYFKEKGIAIADLSPLDMEQLYIDCVKTATGADLMTRKSVAELQRAMLSLMRQLTSYSVQFLTDINQDSFWFVGRIATRLGDYKGALRAINHLNLPNARVLWQRGRLKPRVTLPGVELLPNTRVTAHPRTRRQVDPTVDVRLQTQTLGQISINASQVGVRSVTIKTHHRPAPDNILPGYDV